MFQLSMLIFCISNMFFLINHYDDSIGPTQVFHSSFYFSLDQTRSILIRVISYGFQTVNQIYFDFSECRLIL